jgi:hypothetical protein
MLCDSRKRPVNSIKPDSCGCHDAIVALIYIVARVDESAFAIKPIHGTRPSVEAATDIFRYGVVVIDKSACTENFDPGRISSEAG